MSEFLILFLLRRYPNINENFPEFHFKNSPIKHTNRKNLSDVETQNSQIPDMHWKRHHEMENM